MIKYLIMDVDGTLTDGKIYMSDEGELFKAYDSKDGYAIAHLLPEYSIEPVIITGRTSKIVLRRCKELKIEKVFQGKIDKLPVIREVVGDSNMQYVAYIGDDIPDMVCMKMVKQFGGIVGCPADAVKEVKEIADFISTKNGGAGAVREFVDWIISNC